MGIIKPRYLGFTDRKRIVQQFNTYCKIFEIPKNSFNLITFLYSQKLLNEKKIKNYLKNLKEE